MKTLQLGDLKIEATLSPQRADLRLQLREAVEEELLWSGRLRGPFCAGRQTLAANFPIRTDRASRCGVVTAPDFCCWSSAGPFTYELDLELRAGDVVWARLRDSLAINWAYVHQGKLYQAGKRWVPRLAQVKLPSEATELRNWLQSVREQDLVLVVEEKEASESLLRACQTEGVWVAIDVSRVTANKAAYWETLGCVAMVLCESDSGEARTSLLVAAFEQSAWDLGADVWSVSRSGEAKIIARYETHDSPESARAACDLLQADAAGILDWAGYWG